MTDTITARSGDRVLEAALDHDHATWESSNAPPEGDFPFIAESGGKRYELYSDGTFGEVERNGAQ